MLGELSTPHPAADRAARDDAPVPRSGCSVSLCFAALTAVTEHIFGRETLLGSLDVLALVAVRGVWRTKDAGDGREELRQACARLGPGPAVLRDYVKSTKHYWDEAAYIPELGDQAAAWAIAARFRGLRDDDFTGGFVVRRFERLASAEVRTWWTGASAGSSPRTPIARRPAAARHRPDAVHSALIGSLGLPFAAAYLPGEQTGCGGSSSSAMARSVTGHPPPAPAPSPPRSSPDGGEAAAEATGWGRSQALG